MLMLLVPGPHSKNHCFLELMPILHFCIFVRSDYVSIYNQTIATNLDFPGFFATANSHATNKNLQNRDSRSFTQFIHVFWPRALPPSHFLPGRRILIRKRSSHLMTMNQEAIWERGTGTPTNPGFFKSSCNSSKSSYSCPKGPPPNFHFVRQNS